MIETMICQFDPPVYQDQKVTIGLLQNSEDERNNKKNPHLEEDSVKPVTTVKITNLGKIDF